MNQPERKHFGDPTGTFADTSNCYTNSPEPQAMSDEEQIKIKINTFIWENAPDSLTLGKADEIACKMLVAFIEGVRESQGTPNP